MVLGIFALDHFLILKICSMQSKFLFIFLALTIFACAPTKSAFVERLPANAGLKKIIKAYESIDSDRPERSWNIYTDDEQAERTNQLTSVYTALLNIPGKGLSDMDLINRDVLKYIIDNELQTYKNGLDLMPINSEGGFVTGIYFRCINSQLVNEESKEKYKLRLASIPEYIDWQIAKMNKGVEEGITLPKIIIDKALPLINKHADASASESVFSIPLEGVNDLVYQEEIKNTITKQVIPSFVKLRNYLRNNYYKKARDEIGISGITNGKAFYEQRVKYFTSLDITPDEVYNIGQQEVARIRKDMEGIIEGLNFEGSFADFIEFLRTDPQFYAKTPDEILGYASWLSKKMENEMPKYFGKLPRMPFTVKPVPEAIAPNYTAGRYSSGNYKTNRAGQYWVNTYALDTRPLYALPALTLHEAVPGHHHQGMLAQEIKGVPDFRRNNYLSAFGEGWGLYCEYLGIEVGMYETPYDQFGRMTYEMWRACRLVVDVGMHYKGWTREEAVDFLASNTALSLHEVNTEIDRYIGWPGQAVSYKMGELKIRELRKKAETALGPDFNIRDFHDKVLENGSVLMSTLEGIIIKYIGDIKKP